MNAVAVEADYLSELVFPAAVGEVKFVVAPDINFADEAAFGKDGQGAVDGGAGDGAVNGAGSVEKALCRKVVGVIVRSVKDGHTLIGDTQAFTGQIVPKGISGFFAFLRIGRWYIHDE